MVLQGLSTATYMGWVFGIIFIKSPRQIPIYSTFKSKFGIYALIVYTIMLAIWIDFYIKHLKIIKDDSMVSRFLNLSTSMGATIFDMYFRVCFILRAKLIPRFLKSLETDANKLPPLSREDNKKWRFYSRIIWFTSFYHIAGAMLTTVWISRIVPNAALFRYISSPYYFIIFFFLASLPQISSAFLTFALVVVSTYHLFWIFEDFCLTFEEQINLYNQDSADFLNNPNRVNPGSVTEVKTISSQIPMSTDKLLTKFEHIKLLCNQFDKIVGPLLLGLMVRSVFVLIHSANAILLHNGDQDTEESRTKFILDVFHFLTELSQLALLEMGAFVHQRISEWKEKLSRMIILMSNIGARDQMKDVMRVVSSWEWEITGGPQFFVVERSLLSGVVSSLMTYVVILFQLNVSGDPVPDNTTETIISTTIKPTTTTLLPRRG